jgi:two-component system OmpR family response regulator
MRTATIDAPAPRILVVDDDLDLLTQIASYLRHEGFDVEQARDAREMDRVLEASRFDVVVLDVMLPGEDGLSICARLNRPNAPAVVMLSALSEDVDRIVGLELGADDYLAKPCMPRELTARIRAVLRRRHRAVGVVSRYTGYSFCGFRLDVMRRHLIAPNTVMVLLTPREFRLLNAFVERPNRLLSRDVLLDLIGGEGSEVFDRTIDVLVSRLRGKLATVSDRDLIRTVRGIGYMFDGSVSRH